MRSRRAIILMFVTIAMAYQSCDSTVNIDQPKDFYKYIGMDGNQTGVDLVTDIDGSAYVLGSSNVAGSAYGQQLYVVMTNSKGEAVWTKTYGGPGDDVPKDIKMLSDGSLIVLADRSDGDYAIYHLDKTNGNELAPAVIGGLEKVYTTMAPGSSDDHANTITQTTDGFIVAGYVNNGTYKSALVARYYADFSLYPISWDYQLIQFNQLFGGAGYDLVPVTVTQKDASNFIIFGYTNTTSGGKVNGDYNYFILTTGNGNGPTNELLLIDADPVVHSNERLTSVVAAPIQSGGGFILTGYTSGASGVQDIFVARVVQDLQTAQQSTFLGSTRKIATNLSAAVTSNVSLYPSATSGFYVLGNQGAVGDNNLFLTKLGNDLGDAWSGNTSRTLGGVGDDASGAVAETADGRILVVGTMVLGDLKGQRKLVLMNLNSDGFFGN